MEYRKLLVAGFMLICLAIPVLSDDDVEIEVEDEEEVEEFEGRRDQMPPPEIEWENIKAVTKCRKRLTDDDTAGIHFVGKLASDGSIFYDSREDNVKDEWQSFPMGVGESIKGLELGILGMCKDEIRKVVVEPEMVKNGRHLFDPNDGKIPRGQKLIFEVELMQMGPNYIKGLPNMFKVYDTDKDNLLSHGEIKEYLIKDGTFGPDGPLVSKLAKEVIDKDDRDKDGSLTWKEFSGPKHDEL
ncbi:peptidyl-prolyl cis-trans isomerase FKBP14 [Strongylocentrotus purpuratus]|uniref:peptidylprolyl isomerase n=1 Tax=Strongylocentrotus purpuratus TaxID=7668 RepID=A0A7M7RFD5_STRPU|nr:peptidyl-prolyl cis-trans isomerase FKBP14 [Strongylocentrotus purpuratus]|eukprot:XP_782646.1 PREDICTED: peptidyl-prolyl cis-trans isomerase FKBP14 [Strongylocentrotus purpuratus]